MLFDFDRDGICGHCRVEAEQQAESLKHLKSFHRPHPQQGLIDQINADPTAFDVRAAYADLA